MAEIQNYLGMGYDNNMTRNEGIFGIGQVENNNALAQYSAINDIMDVTGTPNTTDSTDSADGTVDSSTLQNLIIQQTIQSAFYVPRKNGFYINGGSGYAEFVNINISGTITGASIIGGQIETSITGQRIRIVSTSAINPTQEANSCMLIDSSNREIFSFGTGNISSPIDAQVYGISYTDNFLVGLVRDASVATTKPVFSIIAKGQGLTAQFQKDSTENIQNVWIVNNALTTGRCLLVEQRGTGVGLEFLGSNVTNSSDLLQLINSGTGNFINCNNGAFLSNGGTWTNGSSIKLKEDLKEIPEENLIEKIKNLKIYNYRYKKEAKKNIRHLTPTAEEFYELFSLGDNKSISPADLAGLALIGVQYLLDKLD